jgi:nanoRNase/pAp phosphatase (c-di-AMP/oligoRNAs hydrolase)
MKSENRRLARLVAAVEKHERIMVLLHNHPDPDAIASGWALRRLIRKQTGRVPRLVAGGDVIRPENRQMLATFNPPLELLDSLPEGKPYGLVLVDCAAAGNNHLPIPACGFPVGIIDHHPPGHKERYAYRDIRPSVGACASMVICYLMDAGIYPDPNLAAALLYAIRTETRTVEVALSRTDRRAIRWLTQFADHSAIAQIEAAPLSREYFSDLQVALKTTVVVGECAFCLMPSVQGADTLGEVADLLIRDTEVSFALVAAAIGADVLVSVRTDIGGPDAGKLARKTLRRFGDGGGHQRRAGGRIPGVVTKS